MKIVVFRLSPPTSLYNIDKYILDTVDYLSAHGHQIFLMTLQQEEKFNVRRDDFFHVWSTKFPYKNKSLNVPLSYLSYIFHSFKEIFKLSPDLILCLGSGPFYINFFISIFFSRFFGLPNVIEWLGSDLLLHNSHIGNIKKRFFLKQATLNIVQSNDMKEIASNLASTSKLTVIPSNGVDRQKFKPKNNTRQFDERDIFKLLYVGRLHKIKGLEYLIQAVDLVKEYPLNIELRIIGDGPEKKHLKELVCKKELSDFITFIGEIAHDELPKYYQHADIFVLPSLSESFSLVTLEAMSCGLPVVSTTTSGPSQLIDDGDGGLLVPRADPKGLADAIITLVQNPVMMRDAGKYNREKSKQYAQEKIMQKKLKLVEEFSLKHET